MTMCNSVLALLLAACATSSGCAAAQPGAWPWPVVANKTCWQHTPRAANYLGRGEAVAACVKVGDACSGLHDLGCQGTAFLLCDADHAFSNSTDAPPDCVHAKPGPNTQSEGAAAGYSMASTSRGAVRRQLSGAASACGNALGDSSCTAHIKVYALRGGDGCTHVIQDNDELSAPQYVPGKPLSYYCQKACSACTDASQAPTANPTLRPTANPTALPAGPTLSPTANPAASPVTSSPAAILTANPTGPTNSPTASPSASSTASPTAIPG